MKKVNFNYYGINTIIRVHTRHNILHISKITVHRLFSNQCYNSSEPATSWQANNTCSNLPTRCRPSKGRRCIPDVVIKCMLRPTRTISALWHKSKYILKFNLIFFKESNFLGIHVVVLVENLPLMHQLLMEDWYLRSQADFFSRGTDRQTRFWNPHMETCRHKNFNSQLKINGWLSIPICL